MGVLSSGTKGIADSLSAIAGYTDTLETLLTAISGYVDQLEGYTDGIEGYVDGIETLVTATNVALGNVSTALTNLQNAMKVQSFTLKTSGAVTANGSSVDTDISGIKYMVMACLDVTVVTGTDPTLNVIIEAKDDLSGKYSTIATFTQKVTTGTQFLFALDEAKDISKNIRASWVIGGTNTPTFTFSLSLQGGGI